MTEKELRKRKENVASVQQKNRVEREERKTASLGVGGAVSKTARKGSRKSCGQGLAEAVAAAIILIPLAFCLLDLIVLIVANSTNDTLAKNCARAAANQDSQVKALDAAQKSISSFHPSTIVSADSLQLSGFNYDSTKGYVTAQTTMKVHLPMPFPGYSDMTFQALASEPIVNFTPN